MCVFTSREVSNSFCVCLYVCLPLEEFLSFFVYVRVFASRGISKFCVYVCVCACLPLEEFQILYA